MSAALAFAAAPGYARTLPLRVRMPASMGMGSAASADGSEWPGDERAVTRFLAGDVAGFELIVKHYSGMVFSLAARFVGAQEAEDVVQETFLRAYKGLESFRGESSLKTWLYTIALNRVRARGSALTKLKKMLSLSGNGEDDESFLAVLDPKDPAATPEENALQSERRTSLRRAIKALPDEFRTSVVLRDLEGLSYAEIAEVLATPIGTVRSRIARGRALLKEALS